MIIVDKGFIAPFFSKQSQTETETSIKEHSHVLVFNLMFQLISAFFVEILYANEAKTLLFSVLLKSKLYKIKGKTFLCIFIWYCMSRCSNGSPVTTVKAELQFVSLCCNGAKKIINYFSCLKYIIWLRL